MGCCLAGREKRVSKKDKHGIQVSGFMAGCLRAGGRLRGYCILHSVFCILSCLALAGEVRAVSPQIWRENSQAAFEQGDPEGVSLTREGMVTLAPSFSRVADTGEGFVWALAADAGEIGRAHV